jgi:signal transduction histidine kinase
VGWAESGQARDRRQGAPRSSAALRIQARPLVPGGRLWDHLPVPFSVAIPRHGAERAATAHDATRRRRLVALALGAGALALGVGAYRVQVQNHSPHSWAAAQVVVGWAFIAAGLAAWLRRPANRLGPLMLAAGLALLARQFRYSQDALVFTIFFLVGDLSYALVGHSVLAYPSGRVQGNGARLLVKAGYATVIVFPLAVLFLHGTRRALLAMSPLPRRSLLLVSDQAHLVDVLQKAEVIVFYGVLATLFITVIAGRLVRATPRTRRMLAPLLLAAVALALRAVYECVHTFANSQLLAYPYLFWWQIAAGVALPLALLAGMLRTRLARANVSGLVLELDRTPPTPASVRAALSRALSDPSLELLFWLPDQRAFVDEGGVVVPPPAEAQGRAVTMLEHEGEPVAAVIHDPSLREEPELIESAGAAARLALENARLHAETRAQLQQVRDSRRRIVTAADDERRRIERNLHDGAQNRLLALALELSKAHHRLDATADPEVERLLAASVAELQGTVEELRTLARGLHPTVLVEYGLRGALEGATSWSPIPVTLDVCEERFPAHVEATAYFVACEGLANVVKHAEAASASITVRREHERLVVIVEDDGIGGAQAGEGSGLQGMADRVEALGGRADVQSGAGGTRVTAEIPCGP